MCSRWEGDLALELCMHVTTRAHTCTCTQTLPNTEGADASRGADSSVRDVARHDADEAGMDVRVHDLMERVLSVSPTARLVESDGVRVEIAIPRLVWG